MGVPRRSPATADPSGSGGPFRCRLAAIGVAALVTSLLGACGGGGGAITKSGGDDGANPTTVSTVPGGAGIDPGAPAPGWGPKGNVDHAPKDSEKRDEYTYQDDVVFVGGGEKSVVSASSDGLTYRLDGTAEGVDAIKVNSVVYVTQMVVGRAAAVGEQDGDVTVTLAPIHLTDVFRDAEFTFDQTFNEDDAYFQEYSDLPAGDDVPSADTGLQSGTDRPVPSGPSTGGEAEPGTLDTEATSQVGTDEETTVGNLHGRSRVGLTPTYADGPSVTGWDDPNSDEIVVTLPPLVLGRAAPEQNGGGGAGGAGAGAGGAGGGEAIGPKVDDNKRLPSKTKVRAVIERNGWEFEPSVSKTSLGVTVTRALGDDLKVSFDVGFKTGDLRVVANAVVHDSLIRSNDVQVYGLEGIYLGLEAGAATGAAANKKLKFDFPLADLKGPVGTLPLYFMARPAVSLTTVIAGNNSTLTAAGEWGLTGPIGLVDGKVITPTFATVKSIVDSIGGIALAPSGIIVGFSVLFGVGLGNPAFIIGPSLKVSLDVGLINGSALGASLVRCRSATLDVWVGGGAGIYLDSKTAEILQKIFGPKTKVSIDVMKNHNFIHRAVLVPNVPLCADAPTG